MREDQGSTLLVKAREDGIHAIQACTGHQPDIKRGLRQEKGGLLAAGNVARFGNGFLKLGEHLQLLFVRCHDLCE